MSSPEIARLGGCPRRPARQDRPSRSSRWHRMARVAMDLLRNGRTDDRAPVRASWRRAGRPSGGRRRAARRWRPTGSGTRAVGVELEAKRSGCPRSSSGPGPPVPRRVGGGGRSVVARSFRASFLVPGPCPGWRPRPGGRLVGRSWPSQKVQVRERGRGAGQSTGNAAHAHPTRKDTARRPEASCGLFHGARWWAVDPYRHDPNRLPADHVDPYRLDP